MPEGYIRGRPDSDWWIEQIKSGEQFRKQQAFEEKWKIWREYYRGEWSPDVMPVNLFFSMMRTMVPRVYFRNPSVSVMPAKPGFLNLAFARMLERIDNSLLRDMGMKKQMKRMVRDAFMKGTGVGKLGYEALFSPTPQPLAGGIATTKKGHLVEYFSETSPSMPWFRKVSPGNFVVPHGQEDFEDNRWVAERVDRPIEDVLADPRLTNTTGLKSTTDENHIFPGSIHRPVKMARLWEVRDLKTGKVFIIAPDHSKNDKVLLFADDAFQKYGGLNYFPLIFNEDDEAFWGVPDSQIIEPYQLELNEIKTQIMKHRRVTLVKVLVQTGGMEETEAEKLVSEDVQAVAFIKGNVNRDVKVMQQSQIPRELFLAAETIMQDTRETLGMGRNQMGEFNSRSGDTTATEANIVRQAMDIRIDEKRDAVADLLLEIVNMMHSLIFDNWGEDQIIDVFGPGGVQVWVRMRPELLRTGKYNIKIDPDSSIPETKQMREQRALIMFDKLKTNPLIDPIKLTQYLLHELQGPQFDDMMRMMPPVEGVGPGQVMEPDQFAGVLSEGFQNMARGAEPQRGAIDVTPEQ